jgi:hypothetical protein
MVRLIQLGFLSRSNVAAVVTRQRSVGPDVDGSVVPLAYKLRPGQSVDLTTPSSAWLTDVGGAIEIA